MGWLCDRSAPLWLLGETDSDLKKNQNFLVWNLLQIWSPSEKWSSNFFSPSPSKFLNTPLTALQAASTGAVSTQLGNTKAP
jgi:hypothetical protein